MTSSFIVSTAPEHVANRKAWVGALRDGRYRQGVSRLQTKDGTRYCCAGVACVIARAAGVDVAVVPGKGFGSGTTGNLTVLKWATLVDCPAVADWLGVDSELVIDPEAIDPEGGSLYSLNDTGTTFEEIADIIERQEVQAAFGSS